jgi:exodeoxyribonuclease VII large subunit
MVAFLELKTPTAVAVWLGENLTDFLNTVEQLSERISDAATQLLEREKLRLERAARVVSIGAIEMTRRLEVRLERLGADISRRSGEYFLRETHRLSVFSTALGERPVQFLAHQTERLAGFENFVALQRPENILALGFAIVRTAGPDGSAEGGRAVLDPAVLTDGQALEITLARGKITAKKVS